MQQQETLLVHASMPFKREQNCNELPAFEPTTASYEELYPTIHTAHHHHMYD
jgi:hypothetical protein